MPYGVWCMTGCLQRDANWNLLPRAPFRLEQATSETWTWSLPQGSLKWHDDSVVTVGDIQSSFQRIGEQPQWQQFKSAGKTFAPGEVNSTTAAKFTVSYPKATLPDPPRAILGVVPLLPKTQLDKVSTQDPATPNSFVGSGPFRVRGIVADKLVLEANPDYEGPQPQVKIVEFKAYPDSAALAKALIDNQVDAVVAATLDNESAGNLASLIRQTSAPEVAPQACEARLLLNTRKLGWPEASVDDLASALSFPQCSPAWLHKIGSAGIANGIQITKTNPIMSALTTEKLTIEQDLFWLPTDNPRIWDFQGIPTNLATQLSSLKIQPADEGRYDAGDVDAYTLSADSPVGMYLMIQIGPAAYRTDRFEGWFSTPGPRACYANPWAIRQLRPRP